MSREIYTELKDHFKTKYAEDEAIEIAEGKGAQGIKFKGKMFAMFSKGDLLLKSTVDHIESLVSGGIGEPYMAGGKVMKNMSLISSDSVDDWISLSEAVLAHIR
ncbi:MAG: hypothetical protein ACXAE3_03455 [Candidatus Kariarchaeaceae archaeon]|jgi:TfoX/Sxy family transcriptional regulator of competence genes